MPVFDLKRLSAIPSTAGAITRRACAALGEAGFGLAPLLARAGLTRQQVDDDHARISVRSQIRLIELAADAMQDELLGFHLARDFELREMGLLYYVLASSESWAILSIERCATVQSRMKVLYCVFATRPTLQ
jgi:hypothetical protein